MSTAREIIKGPSWHIDEHTTNELGPLACALDGILDAIFPFKHGPACKAILRQCRENTLEVNLTITRAAETTRTVFPALVATVDT